MDDEEGEQEGTESDNGCDGIDGSNESSDEGGERYCCMLVNKMC